MGLLTATLAALLLVGGAAICLIAAVGVLRLPDFFMRMHAATKAGVVGAGLVLLGVAVAQSGTAVWVKALIAIAFLLLTTPIAGHLLARAGYVAGVPLWGGTRENHLQGKLPRGDFERGGLRLAAAGTAAAATPRLRRVLLGLAHGPGAHAALEQALALARTHGAELAGLGIVDTSLLNRVGPVPIGGNHYAAQLRNTRIAQARHRLAETVQAFEQAVQAAGLHCSVQVDEGDPTALLKARRDPGTALVMPSHAWFDQGVDGRQVAVARRLVRCGWRVQPSAAEGSQPLVAFA